MRTKRCTRCGKIKSVVEFSRTSSSKDGLNYWCRSCWKAYNECHEKENKKRHRKSYEKSKDVVKRKSRERYWSDVEKAKEYFRVYSKTLQWKINARKYQHNRRARLSSCRVNDLTATQIKTLLSEACICALCKRPFNNNGRKKTIDHIVPLCRGGDNTLANTQVIDKRCNSKKGKRTNAEFFSLLHKEVMINEGWRPSRSC